MRSTRHGKFLEQWNKARGAVKIFENLIRIPKNPENFLVVEHGLKSSEKILKPCNMDCEIWKNF